MNNYIQAIIALEKLKKLVYLPIPTKGTDLNKMQAFLLYLLFKQKDQDKSYQELIHLLDGAYGVNMSYSMKNLISSGYMKKKNKLSRHYPDTRKSVYEITIKGKDFCRKLDKFFGEIISQLGDHMHWEVDSFGNLLGELDCLAEFLISRGQR